MSLAQATSEILFNRAQVRLIGFVLAAGIFGMIGAAIMLHGVGLRAGLAYAAGECGRSLLWDALAKRLACYVPAHVMALVKMSLAVLLIGRLVGGLL